jgi:hypothetical protein
MASFADRVKDTTTTTGTGSITLSGTAPSGYQTFNAAFGTTSPFFYAIEAVDGSGVPTGDWEVGYGILSASTTLARSQVLASSNSGAAVNFSAGTKNVFCTIPAASAFLGQRLALGRGYGFSPFSTGF